MPFFNSRKKQLQREIEQRDRMRYEQEQRFNEQMHLQQLEADRRARELQDQVRKLEREEFQRAEAERARQEEAIREREREQHRKQQAKLKQNERNNQRRAKLRQTTPEALASLRDLIRERYRLDMLIWSLRNVKEADHEEVIALGRQADSVLEEIHAIVDTWEEGGLWTQEEWRVAKKIRDYLNLDVKRIWENNPPWNDPY